MSALLQAVQAAVFALATAAFAHFGVVLKDAPHPAAEQSVHRAAAADISPPPKACATPCLIARHVDRA